jgi:hypothetical protein
MWQVVDMGTSKIVDGRVVVVFWGDEWTNGKVDPDPYIGGFKGLVDSHYLDAAAQYGAGPMSYETELFFKPAVTRTIPTLNGPQRVFSGSDSDNLLLTKIPGSGFLPSASDPAERLYVVVVPPGVDVDSNWTLDAAGVLWEKTGSTGGWHGAIVINGQRRPVATITSGSVDFTTSIFSHELVEAVTDSYVRNEYSGGGIRLRDPKVDDFPEVADVCGIGGRINGAQVSAYWSAEEGACVVPTLATWTRIAAPGLNPGSVRLVRRRTQLICFALWPDEGAKNSTLLFMLQNDPLHDDSNDDWWTETTAPEWLTFTQVPGVPIPATAGSGSYAVGINSDDAMRVYVITANGQLWQNGETVSPYGPGIWRGWSGWQMIDDLGGHGWGIDAASDRQGRTNLFVSMKTEPGVLRFVQEQPNSRNFLAPQPMSFDAFPNSVQAATNHDGRLEVFGLELRMRPTGSYLTLKHVWEDASGNWSGGGDLDLWPAGTPLGRRHPDSLQPPVAHGRRKDGRIVVSATESHRGWYSLQTGVPEWGGFSQIRKADVLATAFASQRDEQLVIATVDGNRNVWTAIEAPSGSWRAWTNTGSPGSPISPQFLRAALDRHMRIDLLAQLYDGSVWHARQRHPDHAWTWND